MTVYANVAYSRALWINLPAVFPREGPNAESWGRELSLACWADSGLAHGPEDVARMAFILTGFALRLGPGTVHPEHEFDPTTEIQTLLHLAVPRTAPVPLRVMVLNRDVVGKQGLNLHNLAGR